MGREQGRADLLQQDRERATVGGRIVAPCAAEPEPLRHFFAVGHEDRAKAEWTAIDRARLLNPRLSLLGHLVTRSDGRLLVHRTYEQNLRRLYGPTVFQTVIPEASAFKVSLACRQPLNGLRNQPEHRLKHEDDGKITFAQGSPSPHCTMKPFLTPPDPQSILAAVRTCHSGWHSWILHFPKT